LSLERPLAKDK